MPACQVSATLYMYTVAVIIIAMSRVIITVDQKNLAVILIWPIGGLHEEQTHFIWCFAYNYVKCFHQCEVKPLIVARTCTCMECTYSFLTVGIICSLYKYRCTYRISLISSPGLLFFSSYWDGEATIQGRLLNEGGVYSLLLLYRGKFSRRIIFTFFMDWSGTTNQYFTCTTLILPTS